MPSGLHIVSLTSPVRPGQTARLDAQASPNANCTITYTTPAGSRSTARGLAPKSADCAGNVSWSWTIGSNTNPGTGRVVVSCDGQSASAAIVIAR